MAKTQKSQKNPATSSAKSMAKPKPTAKKLIKAASVGAKKDNKKGSSVLKKPAPKIKAKVKVPPKAQPKKAVGKTTAKASKTTLAKVKTAMKKSMAKPITKKKVTSPIKAKAAKPLIKGTLKKKSGVTKKSAPQKQVKKLATKSSIAAKPTKKPAVKPSVKMPVKAAPIATKKAPQPVVKTPVKLTPQKIEASKGKANGQKPASPPVKGDKAGQKKTTAPSAPLPTAVSPNIANYLLPSTHFNSNGPRFGDERVLAPTKKLTKIPHEKYLLKKDIEQLRLILNDQRRRLLEGLDNAVQELQEEMVTVADPNDRASQETDLAMELRERDRETRLIRKIDDTLSRMEHKDYGYCEECGVEIGLKRLIARPMARLCIDCKELEEFKEKQTLS